MVFRSSARSGASPTSYPFSLPLRGRQRATTAPKTVHAALSSFFTAYAVFLPKLTSELNLYDVIFIQSSPDLRSWSPKITTTNLKLLVDGRESSFAESGILQSFQEEFDKVEESSEDYADLERSMSVTESSLLTCGVSLGTYISNSVKLGFANARCNMREIRVSDVWWEAYRGGGGGLKRLIWEHAEILLPLILAELEEELGDVGDKRLMAVTTKRIGAIVGVRNAAVRNTTVGTSSRGEGATVTFGIDSSASSDEVYDNHAGICGIHFILLPVERTETSKWRFYRTTDVCNAEVDDHTSDPSLASQDTFYKAKAWHQAHGSADGPTNSSIDVEQCQSSSTRSRGLQKQSCAKDLGYVDIFRSEVRKSSVDVQIACMDSFAMLQCRLAAQYRANAGCDQRLLQHSVHLVRKALSKGSYEATVRALYDLSKSYLLGKGLPFERSTGRALKYCARALKHLYTCRRFYMTLLQNDASLKSACAPELRIAMIMSTTGWPLRTCHFLSGGPYSLLHQDVKYGVGGRYLILLALCNQHDGLKGMFSEYLRRKGSMDNFLDWLEEEAVQRKVGMDNFLYWSKRETRQRDSMDSFLDWFGEEIHRRDSMDTFLNWFEKEILQKGKVDSLLDSLAVEFQLKNKYSFFKQLKKEFRSRDRVTVSITDSLYGWFFSRREFQMTNRRRRMPTTFWMSFERAFSLSRRLLYYRQRDSMELLRLLVNEVEVLGRNGDRIVTMACKFLGFLQKEIERKDRVESFLDCLNCHREDFSFSPIAVVPQAIRTSNTAVSNKSNSPGTLKTVQTDKWKLNQIRTPQGVGVKYPRQRNVCLRPVQSESLPDIPEFELPPSSGDSECEKS